MSPDWITGLPTLVTAIGLTALGVFVAVVVVKVTIALVRYMRADADGRKVLRGRR